MTESKSVETSSPSLAQRGARGGSVIVAGQVIRLAIQLAGTMLLARLLSPADFGLIAMVLVFSALGTMLRDFGLSTVVLQARTLSQQQISNLFWLSSALSVAVAAMLAASTPLIVMLYDEPRLATLAPVLAVSLLLDGIQAPLQMLLARRMQFKTLVATDLIAQTLSLSLALWAAVAGWGYWALVLQVLAASLVLLLLRSISVRWVPSLPRRGHGSREHFRTSGEFGLAHLLSFIANNADTLVVGARLGAVDLGYYSRAFQLYVLPRTGILDPLTQVAIPALKGPTGVGQRSFDSMLLKLQLLLSFFMIWVYAIAAATADSLVPLVLGNQWTTSIVAFQLLCIGGAFVTFSTVSYWMFVLESKSRELLHLHLITKPLAVALVLVAVPYGIEMVALAYAVGIAVSWPINLIWLARTVGQDSWAFFRAGLRTLIAGVVAFVGASSALSFMPEVPLIVNVLLGAGIGSVLYVLTLLITPGGPAVVKTTLATAIVALKRPSAPPRSQ